jgi:hypothetical protein
MFKPLPPKFSGGRGGDRSCWGRRRGSWRGRSGRAVCRDRGGWRQRGFQQNIEEGAVGFDGQAVGVIDEVVGLVAAGMRGETHHHRFGDDQAVGHASAPRSRRSLLV